MPIDEELLKGSEARLWKLIEERTKTGADREAIDSRIWELFGEEWAVLFTDLAGFSRQAETFGIIHFLQIIFEARRLLMPVVADHGGVMVKAEADSFLLLFRRADAALACAIEMQRICQAESASRVADEKILLCLGLGHGRILRIGDHDVWGSEVNAASKLGEDTARAGDILVTGAFRRALSAGQDRLSFDELDAAIPGSADNYRVIYQ